MLTPDRETELRSMLERGKSYGFSGCSFAYLDIQDLLLEIDRLRSELDKVVDYLGAYHWENVAAEVRSKKHATPEPTIAPPSHHV